MRILCVDDDGLILSITADLLRMLGHDVVEVIGGRRAVSRIGDDDGFDLIVTDIHMPGGPDGRDIALLARRSKPGLPVIYFSGIDQMTPNLPGDHVVRKPCTLGKLQQAIELAAPTGLLQ